eukprot:143955-Chlamydomonas_euryale.AAC.1
MRGLEKGPCWRVPDPEAPPPHTYTTHHVAATLCPGSGRPSRRDLQQSRKSLKASRRGACSASARACDHRAGACNHRAGACNNYAG